MILTGAAKKNGSGFVDNTLQITTSDTIPVDNVVENFFQ
jgi:hypothetical protein